MPAFRGFIRSTPWSRFTALVAAIGVLLGVMAVSPSPAAAAEPPSDCWTFNADVLDDQYDRFESWPVELNAGDKIRVSANEPTSGGADTALLKVNGAVVDGSAVPGWSTYEVPTTGTYTVEWLAMAGLATGPDIQVTWAVSCGFGGPCETLNDPFFDAQGASDPFGGVAFNGTFDEGDHITITASSAGGADPTQVWLFVDDEQIDVTLFPTTVEYDVTVAGGHEVLAFVYPDLPVNWEVSCQGPPPDCGAVTATPTVLKADSKLKPITITGASSSFPTPLIYEITGVTQDEPTSGGWRQDVLTPDAGGVQYVASLEKATVHVRAERNPKLDGRVYEVAYTVTNGEGSSCSGIVEVKVPVKRGGEALNGGDYASWNSYTGALLS
jgi:hypothetical protein